MQALAEMRSPKSQDAAGRELPSPPDPGRRLPRASPTSTPTGVEQNPTIRFVSHNVDDNEFLAVNQVTIRSAEVERRFDIVLYLNGLPVVIASSSVRALRRRTSRRPMLSLRRTCASSRWRSAASCSRSSPTASHARYGTPFTPLNHYSPWNVDDDGKPLGRLDPAIRTRSRSDESGCRSRRDRVDLVDGVCNQERFLQLQRRLRRLRRRARTATPSGSPSRTSTSP